MRGLFFNMIHVRSVILLNDILQIHMEGRFFFSPVGTYPQFDLCSSIILFYYFNNHLLYARNTSEYFTNVDLFNTRNSPVR